MKLLHTSDWHIGRTLHGHDLHAFHQSCFDFLVDVVEREGVEAVLVAGDVYDRAVPGADSVRLLDRTLARLCAVTTVILTSGNHDSPHRLGFGSGLLQSRLRICTRVGDIATPIVLRDERGTEVCIYALPYLEPDVVRPHFAADGFEEREVQRSHEGILSAAMRRVHADLAQRPAARAIVMAHAFVIGGSEASETQAANAAREDAQTSDSERDIRVGGIDVVPSGVFEGVDYVALGHLHGAQEVKGVGDTRLRYSGSPLAFSFSEKDHRKSVTLLEFDASGLTELRVIDCPAPRPMSEIKGTLDELLSEAYAPQTQHWVKATLTDAKRPPDAVQRLRQRFTYLVQTDFAPQGFDAEATLKTTVTTQADPRDVTADFVDYVTGSPADAAERELIELVHEQARIESGSDS